MPMQYTDICVPTQMDTCIELWWGLSILLIKTEATGPEGHLAITDSALFH